MQVYNQSSSPTSVTDPNGNQISVSGTGVFTDTLGTTALTVGGTAPSPTTFTYSAPSGAAASYAMSYATYTVKTNFACSGVAEYGPTASSLVDRITLPDGTFYQFHYEATPGFAGDVTGRLSSVTLPTGGTISYTYTGGSNGIVCADGSTAGLSRVTPDGTWTYARTAGTGAAYTTTVTDPSTAANQTKIQFQGIYETQRQTYQGSIASGTLLQTVNTCYNAAASPCTATAITLPITQRTVLTSLGATTALTKQCIYKYDASSGALTEQDDYDFGSGAPGALLRKTAITLASLGNITAFPKQVTVTNSAGATVAQTNYNYDETAVTATSGTPQHISVTGSRGNLTSVQSFINATTSLISHTIYYDTGTPNTSTDVNAAVTTYTYGATTSCGNSFPTSISEPLSLSKSIVWNCTGGVPTSVTDENGQITTASYTDPDFWRPNSVTDPTSAVASMSYVGQTSVETALNFNAGASTADSLTTVDALGRSHVRQTRQAPGSTNFDSVETDYDALGRPSRSTLAYAGTAGQTSSTAPAVTTLYDALSRPTLVSDSGGGSTAYSYSQNDVLIGGGPAPTGENLKRRQLEYDGLGRLTSVCELTVGTTAAPAGTCAQNMPQTGYWTKYTYDANGNLLTVTQNAQAAAGSQQTRTYTYDELSRLKSEANPETGSIAYTYDTDVSCGTSSNDLVKRVDAVGNTLCYAYDALHRTTSVTYSGPYAANTPNKYFVYDSATVNSVAMSNAKTRLAEAYTCTGACTSKITDLGLSYTVRGEPSDIYESTPNSGGYYHVAEQYWANGAIKQVSGLTALPTFTFNADGEGRPFQVSASVGQNPVTNTIYNTASLPTSLTYGSTDTDAFTYDPSTNRMTQYQFTVNGQSLTGALTWNTNHSLQALNITDALNPADTQSCSFSHDDLKRIQSANCGAAWSQTFSYDAFGNISKSGSMSFAPTYSAATNRITSVAGFTLTYDANGNTLTDPAHSYSWDANGRPASIDSVSLTYDALGRMVEQNRSGAFTQIVYGPNGGKFALMNGASLQKAMVPLPGGAVAVYNSAGLLYYGHADHSGSMRLGSTSTRTVSFDLAYAPFGETYTSSGTTDPAFTGQRQDTVAGLYDFPAREYNTQGRWPSPDPSGIAAVDPSDPQTFNRFAYVRNTPLSLVDPFGLSPSNIHVSAAFRVASSNDNYGILNSQGQDEFDQMNGNFALQQISYSLANNNIPDPCQTTGILCNHPDPNGSGATIGDFNGEALCTLNGSDPTCHYLYWNSSAQLWLEPDAAFGISPLQQYFTNPNLDSNDILMYMFANQVNWYSNNIMTPCQAAADGVGAGMLLFPPAAELELTGRAAMAGYVVGSGAYGVGMACGE